MAATATRASTLSRESNVRLVNMDCSLPCRDHYSIEQTFSRCSGFHFRQIGFFEGDALQGRPPFPANTLKLRFGTEVIYIAQAEVGHRLNVGGDAEHGPKCVGLQDADPADANPLRARSKPQILYRADGRVDRRLRHGLPPKAVSLGALRVAQDAEILRRLQDALELQI